VQERRFPGSGRRDDGDHLAGRDGQFGVQQNLQQSRAGSIGAGNASSASALLGIRDPGRLDVLCAWRVAVGSLGSAHFRPAIFGFRIAVLRLLLVRRLAHS
jgi:hypothetical protein